MNTHIYITSITQPKDCMGLIIKFKEKNDNEYHTYLDNAETAQLAKELTEILCYNLYQIDEWINKNNEEE